MVFRKQEPLRRDQSEHFVYRHYSQQQNSATERPTSRKTFPARQTVSQASLTVPQSEQSMPHPIFRFYSPTSLGYLSDRMKGSLVVINNRNPFSEQVEWEWISIDGFTVGYLRNHHSKRYLCFNSNGRPAMLRQIHHFSKCLLRLNVALTTERSLEHKVNQEKTSQKDSHQKPFKQSPRNSSRIDRTQSPRWGRNEYPVAETMLPLLKDRTSHPVKAGIPYLALPQLMWWSTARHLPEWKMLFCPNGMPFTHYRPLHSRCKHTDLSRTPEQLIMCPEIPPYCRVTCGPQSFMKRTRITEAKCDLTCLQAISCSIVGK